VAAPLAEKYLLDGKLAEGAKALQDRLKEDPRDGQAQFGLGVVQFLQTFEHLGGSLYTYGLRTEKAFLRPPPQVKEFLPQNPNPEKLTYPAARQIIQTFIDDVINGHDAEAVRRYCAPDVTVHRGAAAQQGVEAIQRTFKRDSGLDYALDELTVSNGGKGVNYVIECSGAPDAINEAARMVNRGGRICLAAFPGKPAEVDVAHIVRNNIYVFGIRGEGKSATHRAEAFMAQKRFDATKVHTHTFALEDLPTAIRIAHGLADYGIFWSEDPVKMVSADVLADYRRHARVPVCGSETLATRHAFRELLTADASDPARRRTPGRRRPRRPRRRSRPRGGGSARGGRRLRRPSPEYCAHASAVGRAPR